MQSTTRPVKAVIQAEKTTLTVFGSGKQGWANKKCYEVASSILERILGLFVEDYYGLKVSISLLLL